MWLITTDGMFSAVEHADDQDLIVVRTRVKADVDFLHDWLRGVGAPSEIVTYEASDYPWRTITTKSGWATYCHQAAQDVSYGNFKDQVTALQGKPRHDVYAAVWAALLRLEVLDPDRRREPLWPLWTDDDDQDHLERCAACGSPLAMCDMACLDPFSVGTDWPMT